MVHHASRVFWKHYQALPTDIQVLADKQFTLLQANPQYPSLQFKKLGERRGQEIWSARVTLQYRALAVKFPDAYVWYWIGEHGRYDVLMQ